MPLSYLGQPSRGYARLLGDPQDPRCGAGSSVVPGIDPRGRHAEEPQDGNVLGEPLERLACRAASGTSRARRHRLAQIGMLGRERLGHPLHVHARQLDPVAPAIDHERHPRIAGARSPRWCRPSGSRPTAPPRATRTSAWRRAARRRAAPWRSGTRARRGTPGAAGRGRRSRDRHQRARSSSSASIDPALERCPDQRGLSCRANQVVDGLAPPAGRRLTVEQIVAQLERLAQRPAERVQRGALRVRRRPRRRRRPAAGPPRCRRRPSAWRHRLATARFPCARPVRSRYWPSAISTPHLVVGLGRSRQRSGSNPAPSSSRSASTAARSPANTATDEPNRRGPPVTRARRRRSEVGGRGRHAAPLGRAVHQVVVDQRHRVQELEGRRRPARSVPRPHRRPRGTPSSRRPAAAACRPRSTSLVGLLEHRQRARFDRLHPRVARRPGTRTAHRRSARAGRATPRKRRPFLRRTCGQYLAPTPPAPRTMMAREPLMTRSQKLALATAGTTIVLFSVGGLVRGTGSGLGCSTWPGV